jgi:hypothetical protein
VTTTIGYRERNRDIQDGTERHIYKDVEYIDGAGSVVRVEGTGSEDQEAPVIATGYGFTLKKGTDAEVILLSLGSDTDQKYALVQLPADKQRKWPEGRGGVQNPTDATHALEFRDGRLHLTKGSFTVGDGNTIDVRDGQIYMRGKVTIDGPLIVNGGITTPSITPGTDTNVPDPTP